MKYYNDMFASQKPSFIGDHNKPSKSKTRLKYKVFTSRHYLVNNIIYIIKSTTGIHVTKTNVHFS